MSKIAVIVLAAGASTRMGNNIKQLLPWKGITLLQHAIQEVESCEADTIFLVLGANFDKIKENILPTRCQIIENKNWKSGLGSSIAFGINNLKILREEYDAVLISLADQPLIDTEYYNYMLSVFKKSTIGIVTTAYKTRKGVPAIFEKQYFEALSKLNEDYGAKQILNNERVEIIYPKGKEVDIDTWEDYQTLFKKIHNDN
tara:strand:- start:9002 stop:9604 length:603 start_codon:yes stop_codon:yes gene_type:complete